MASTFSNERASSEHFAALPAMNFSPCSSFTFNYQLDAAYLHEFYENDWAAAAAMFNIFLRSTVQTCQQIFEAYRRQHFDLLQQLVHKVRASFKMVGLGKLDPILVQLERAEPATLRSKVASDLLRRLHLAINEYLPIIKQEAKRLAALASRG